MLQGGPKNVFFFNFLTAFIKKSLDHFEDVKKKKKKKCLQGEKKQFAYILCTRTLDNPFERVIHSLVSTRRCNMQHIQRNNRFIKGIFSELKISRRGPVSWLPRSCNLTPLDNFLWGYVKVLVCAVSQIRLTTWNKILNALSVTLQNQSQMELLNWNIFDPVAAVTCPKTYLKLNDFNIHK